MLAIKLKPIGKKHQRSFRIVAAEKRSKLQGRFLEDLGWYNPSTDKYSLKEERIKFFLENGSEPTDTVWNLLVKGGIIKGKKRAVHKKIKKQEEKQEKTQEEKQEKKQEEKQEEKQEKEKKVER